MVRLVNALRNLVKTEESWPFTQLVQICWAINPSTFKEQTMKKRKSSFGCFLLTGNRNGPSRDSSFTNEEGRWQQSWLSQAAPVRFRKRVESRSERQVWDTGFRSLL